MTCGLAPVCVAETQQQVAGKNKWKRSLGTEKERGRDVGVLDGRVLSVVL